MIYLEIADYLLDTNGSPPVESAALVSAAQQTLAIADASPDDELTLALADDVQLHQLNLQFLDIDAPTDVLSFPAGDIDPESGFRYLGEVVISIERARAQAAVGGHSLLSEMQLLVVHGVLHLLGYDHTEADQKAHMWSKQTEILVQLGAAITSPTE